MKNIKIICCLFFVLAILVSCSSKKPVVVENNTTLEKTITETVHDTVFKIEKDSSSYRALLEYQNGKILIKNVSKAEPGRTLKSPKVRIANNELQVDCEARAQELFVKWKSTYIKENKQEVKEVPITTNLLTWWQQTQIRGFWLLFITLSLWLVWRFVKSKYNIKVV